MDHLSPFLSFDFHPHALMAQQHCNLSHLSNSPLNALIPSALEEVKSLQYVLSKSSFLVLEPSSKGAFFATKLIPYMNSLPPSNLLQVSLILQRNHLKAVNILENPLCIISGTSIVHVQLEFPPFICFFC